MYPTNSLLKPEPAADLWDQVCAVVEGWHGKEVFDLYRDHSPEMKQIKAAIAALASPKAQRAQGPPLDGLTAIPCAVMLNPGHPQNGWLFIPHVDGKWVTLTKLGEFSGKIIEHWLAAAQAPKDEDRHG